MESEKMDYEFDNCDWLDLDFDQSINYTDEITPNNNCNIDYNTYSDIELGGSDGTVFDEMLESLSYDETLPANPDIFENMTDTASVSTETTDTTNITNNTTSSTNTNTNVSNYPKNRLQKSDYVFTPSDKPSHKMNAATITKVKWSVKNKVKGKTYQEYIKRQLKIARRICSHMVKLMNNQDIEIFCDFVDRYVVDDLIMHEVCKGTHPLTGEMNVNHIITGKDKLKAMATHAMKNIPDSVSIVESTEVLNEGKLVRMYVTDVGTPMAYVPVDEVLIHTTSTNNTNTNNTTTSISSIIKDGDTPLRKTRVYSGVSDMYLDKNNFVVKMIYTYTEQ